MRLHLLGSEAALSHTADTDFGAAHLVRCYNTTNAAIVVTLKTAGGATLGTVSILPNSVEILKKAPGDKLRAAATGILAVNIAKTN